MIQCRSNIGPLVKLDRINIRQYYYDDNDDDAEKVLLCFGETDGEGMSSGRSYGEDLPSSPRMGADDPDGVKVTRSIMIVKPPGYHNQTAGSAPASPAGSTPPVSPFSGNRSGAFRFRRRSTSDANEKEAASEDRASRNTPPP